MKLPTCGVCGREVEEMRTTDDAFMRRWTIRVRCHGEVETVVVTHAELERAGAISLDGVAFRRPPRLPIASGGGGS